MSFRQGLRCGRRGRRRRARVARRGADSL